MHALVIFNSGFCEHDKQGYGKQELCPASLFNFDYEREPAGTWEKSELCPYLNSQESKQIMSEIAEIWEFRIFFFAHNHTIHSQVKTCIVSYICNENPLKEADNRTMSKTYVKYSTSH